MIEKQYYVNSLLYLCDNDLSNTLNIFECADLLNQLTEENEKLRKKLECCEYSHFLNELDEIHEKVDKGDLSDFSPLKVMSEKRYYVNCAGYLCDKDLSNTLSIFECADLLNQLTEENEQLKQKVDFYKYF